MPDGTVWAAGRKIACVVAAIVAVSVSAIGVSQAATVPQHSHSGVMVMRNDTNYNITDYRLQYVDPMTGLYDADPVGDGEVYAVHWTWVSKNQANGTGKYDWGRMGSYRNGPVNLVLLGSDYKYTRIDITLTQSWYGYTNSAYPPYGHGQHHTFTHTRVAVEDPTTNLVRF